MRLVFLPFDNARALGPYLEQFQRV